MRFGRLSAGGSRASPLAEEGERGPPSPRRFGGQARDERRQNAQGRRDEGLGTRGEKKSERERRLHRHSPQSPEGSGAEDAEKSLEFVYDSLNAVYQAQARPCDLLR